MSGGGSSSVFRKMLEEAAFIRSASWMMATWYRDSVGETLIRVISSRTIGAVIMRALPAGRSWKQSGWRSAGRGDVPGLSVEEPVGDGERRRREALGVVAGEKESVRQAPAADRLLDHGHGGRARQRGRPGRRCRCHPLIRALTASQIFFSVAASSLWPSTTTKRSGIPLARTR